MSIDTVESCLFAIVFVEIAVLLSQLPPISAPPNDCEIRTRIVKTIAVNVNEEAGL